MIELHKALSRWARVLRARHLGVRLRHLESERCRAESMSVAGDGDGHRVRAHRLHALCVETARVRYLIAVLEERIDYPSAAAAYRRQEVAVSANCSSGHSPRSRARVAKASDK